MEIPVSPHADGGGRAEGAVGVTPATATTKARFVGKTPTMHGFECLCCSPDGDVALLSPAVGKLMGGRSKAADFDVDAVSSR